MRIGMIGGIGPESTVDYYPRLINLYQKNVSGDDYPEIVIKSINMTAMLKLVSGKDWDGLASMLAGSVRALQNAGADLAFIASNTPHIVFEKVKLATGSACQHRGGGADGGRKAGPEKSRPAGNALHHAEQLLSG